MKDYCTENNGDCLKCRWANYGQDCNNKPISLETKFQYSGKWWNGGQTLITKDGKTYALYGWNGVSYTDSWQVIDSSENAGKYDIQPAFEQVGQMFGEPLWEIVDYIIK